MQELTKEQMLALVQYAAEKGGAWKRHLHFDWMKASLIGPLHEMRNTLGPEWLEIVSLPQVQHDLRKQLEGPEPAQS